MSWMIQDVRRAVRLFRQAPWFTSGVILIIALGTGLNSAVLATTYGILVRPLPYVSPSRLAILQHSVPLLELDQWRQGLRTVEGAAGFATAEHTIRGLGDQGKRARVVGVVEDIRYKGLAAPSIGAVYVPWDQLPMGSVYLVVRTLDAPLALAPSVRAIVRRLDPEQPIGDVQSMEDVLRSSIADRRLHAMLAVSFALLAFAVAILGLVAAMSRTVTDRQRELAVRAALGATPIDTLRLVMGDATRLAVAGVTIGIPLAMLAGRGLAARLFGVTPYDPMTYAVVPTAAGLVALLACLGPATRAVSVDPSTLLRSE